MKNIFCISLFLISLYLTQAAKWAGDFANFPNSWPLKSAGSSTNREVINDPTGGNGNKFHIEQFY